MNQTQTRSPRKRLLSLILAVILMIGLLPISAFATSASAQAGEDKAATQDSEFLRIFHLDCGRKYFTVSEIEGIIDQLAKNHFTHLQLAFGNNGFRFLLNDMSVKANNKTYSSDDVKNAVTNGNATYSNGKNTASTMLSETDMDTIIAYAKGKDISIIPMLNTPGHMDALVSAMNKLGVGTQRTDSEMSLTSDAQVEFIKAFQQKYITYFASKGSEYYNLAADEYSFSGLSDTEYTAFAKYVNEVAKMVKDAKMTPLAYNDGFLYSGKTSSVPFDEDIMICYWAQGTNYASVTELHNAGFKILNNNDAWYYVLGDYLYDIWSNDQWGYEDALKGIKSTPVTQAKKVADKEIPVAGSVLCCWCDGPSKSWADSKDNVYDLIATMAKYNPDYFTDSGSWAVSSDRENWTNVTGEGSTGGASSCKEQVIAYYTQRTDVTQEVITDVVDWGNPTDKWATERPTQYGVLDFAVKYPDGTRVPDSFPETGKTVYFHCDESDKTGVVFQDGNSNYYRRIGLINGIDTTGYEIYMITVTPTSDTPTEQLTGKNIALTTSTKIEYKGTEKVAWVDDEGNLPSQFKPDDAKFSSISGNYQYTVGGNPNIEGLEIYQRQGMLVTYYIRPVATMDSLHVHYINKNTGNEFYTYPINVKVEFGKEDKAVFNSQIGLDTPWKGPLKNGTVVNDMNVKQTVSADLSTMPAIGAEYRYSTYTCVEVVRSDNGKDVYLYYTFTNSKTFVFPQIATEPPLSPHESRSSLTG